MYSTLDLLVPTFKGKSLMYLLPEVYIRTIQLFCLYTKYWQLPVS